ncbi:MAG TPA: hypothetical protein VJN29_01060 [Intrasporangium sp.]|uniref:hypothetical protein n=1 Tax=Intrasporangium sp. TaxID=1925024 RepID=UPI002B489637|nr:hypothetical protein [Intrasporangium sp.]HKX65787.1 hypothetical protein [Intrasporangium sp.]
MTVTEQSTDSERRTIYIVVGVVVLVLLVIALFSYRSKEATQQADQKADQFIATLSAAGAATPSKDMVVRVLGDDGGAICQDPNAALSRAALLDRLMNGAAGPGMRPVIADNRAVKGELLVIQIYCPDELPTFEEFVNSLNLDDIVKD